MAILEKERKEVMRVWEELLKVKLEDEEEERLYNEMVKEYNKQSFKTRSDLEGKD